MTHYFFYVTIHSYRKHTVVAEMSGIAEKKWRMSIDDMTKQIREQCERHAAKNLKAYGNSFVRVLTKL